MNSTPPQNTPKPVKRSPSIQSWVVIGAALWIAFFFASFYMDHPDMLHATDAQREANFKEFFDQSLFWIGLPILAAFIIPWSKK